MNPIANNKPIPTIGSFHAEKGKIFHVHKSSVVKERSYIEMKPYRVGGTIVDIGEDKKKSKVPSKENGIYCPKCWQVVSS